MLRTIRLILPVIILMVVSPVFGQKAVSIRTEPNDKGRAPARIYAKVNGREIKIADEAWKAWIVREGRVVLYSSFDGAGGFENEGQSLYSYDVRTGQRQKLMAEYGIVDEVKQITSRKGCLAYLVTLTDSAVGAPTTAIVAPERGEVYRLHNGKVRTIKDGKITLDVYTIGAFDPGKPEKPKPVRTETVNLDDVLKRPVILNPRRGV